MRCHHSTTECGLIQSSIFRNKRGDAPFIIYYYPAMNSRLNFIDILLADLDLEMQIEDSNEGAEVSVM